MFFPNSPCCSERVATIAQHNGEDGDRLWLYDQGNTVFDIGVDDAGDVYVATGVGYNDITLLLSTHPPDELRYPNMVYRIQLAGLAQTGTSQFFGRLNTSSPVAANASNAAVATWLESMTRTDGLNTAGAYQIDRGPWPGSPVRVKLIGTLEKQDYGGVAGSIVPNSCTFNNGLTFLPTLWKFDSEGHLLWRIGLTSDQSFNGWAYRVRRLAIDNQSNIVCLCERPFAAGPAYLIRKYDSDGNLLWSVTSYIDLPQDLAIDDSRNIYIVGLKLSAVTPSITIATTQAGTGVGTFAVQTVTAHDVNGGQFGLYLAGGANNCWSGPFDWNATAFEVETTMNAYYPSRQVTVTGGPWPNVPLAVRFKTAVTEYAGGVWNPTTALQSSMAVQYLDGKAEHNWVPMSNKIVDTAKYDEDGNLLWYFASGMTLSPAAIAVDDAGENLYIGGSGDSVSGSGSTGHTLVNIETTQWRKSWGRNNYTRVTDIRFRNGVLAVTNGDVHHKLVPTYQMRRAFPPGGPQSPTREIYLPAGVNTPDGGTFYITFDGAVVSGGNVLPHWTASIPWNATSSEVQDALDDAVGLGTTICAGGPLPASLFITPTGTFPVPQDPVFMGINGAQLETQYFADVPWLKFTTTEPRALISHLTIVENNNPSPGFTANFIYGGSFRIKLGANVSADLPWNARATDVQQAIRALADDNTLSASGGPLPNWTIFITKPGPNPVPQFTIDEPTDLIAAQNVMLYDTAGEPLWGNRLRPGATRVDIDENSHVYAVGAAGIRPSLAKFDGTTGETVWVAEHDIPSGILDILGNAVAVNNDGSQVYRGGGRSMFVR